MKPMPWEDETIAANGRRVLENFADWFGASKVLDGNGCPLMVHHGTSANITTFDPKKVGTLHVDVMRDLSDTDLDPTAFYFSNDKATARWYAKSAAKITKVKGNVVSVYLAMKNPLIVDFQGAGIEWLAEDLERAKTDGHDGLIALNFNDGGVSDHYIVFEAKNIKSASSNSGLYLKDSQNIDDHDEAKRLLLARNAAVAIKQKTKTRESQP